MHILRLTAAAMIVTPVLAGQWPQSLEGWTTATEDYYREPCVNACSAIMGEKGQTGICLLRALKFPQNWDQVEASCPNTIEECTQKLKGTKYSVCYHSPDPFSYLYMAYLDKSSWSWSPAKVKFSKR